ncbi:hypothetical protein [Nostoc sp.]|uniref:hypothetical protein n=1 Tax=Nostoc sp. TaxID=1180 RepID=UPI002FF6A10E
MTMFILAICAGMCQINIYWGLRIGEAEEQRSRGAGEKLYHVRVISCDSHNHCTPPTAPPRSSGGETKHSFGGVGFLGFSK